MYFGQIAEEMVITPTAASAPPYIRLFQHSDLDARLSGRNSRRKSGYAAAHDNKIRIHNTLDGNHFKLLSFG